MQTKKPGKKELLQLKMLANPIRMHIYQALIDPMTIGALCGKLKLGRKSVSYHTVKLHEAGLVTKKKGIKIGDRYEPIFEKVFDTQLTVPVDAAIADTNSALYNLMKSMVDDFYKSEKRRPESMASASRKTIRTSREKLFKVGKMIIEERENFWEKIMYLNEEKPDDPVDVEVMFAFFEKVEE